LKGGRAGAIGAVLLAFQSLAAQPAAARVTSLAPPADYDLVWSDEFDRPGLPDPARWSFDTEFNSRGWHNGEEQYYAAGRLRNSRVENGHLLVAAHRERLEARDDWGGQEYTSARLVTRGKAAWRYGFFEIRAKLPCGRGTWPAFWLLPQQRSPDFVNGEIDIMEHVGHRPGTVFHSVQTGRRNHRRGNHPIRNSHVADACGAFHTYQLHWTRDRIMMGVDGVASFTFERSSLGDWPFAESFYLIINLAVGGSMGGARGIDRSAFPALLMVDWVRVYQFRSET
jgi:beta-glucanase (GH16 family)